MEVGGEQGIACGGQLIRRTSSAATDLRPLLPVPPEMMLVYPYCVMKRLTSSTVRGDTTRDIFVFTPDHAFQLHEFRSRTAPCYSLAIPLPFAWFTVALRVPVILLSSIPLLLSIVLPSLEHGQRTYDQLHGIQRRFCKEVL